MKVFVYRNLHRKCLSIKALEGKHKRKVIGYAAAVGIVNAEYRVNEAGRQRVLLNKRKHVHAGVVGYMTFVKGWEDRLLDEQPVADTDLTHDELADGGTLLYYNPYKTSKFQTPTGQTVTASARSYVTVDGAFAWRPTNFD